jgi:MFS family permease
LIARLRRTYESFPSTFWMLVVGSFIDRLGGTMLFPFFALYITERFNVGMSEAGLLLGLFSLFSAVGSMFAGALTDRVGRKTMILLGLILSAASSVVMGFIGSFPVFFVVAIFVGLVAFIGDPAHQAMVADLVPEEKREEAFGILRVAVNLSWVIGPTIGGLIAARSYLYVFFADAIASLITAALVLIMIPETMPERAEGEGESESLLQTLVGYREVGRDRVYVAFLVVSMLMILVYNQLYNTLSVYLRDVHGLAERSYGLLMSMNASTVVLLQFWIASQVRKYAPLLMMAFGAGLYVIGFTLYGVVGTFALFAAAMFIITVGEMVVMPVGQALVARLAPVHMRGRYMAVYSLSWTIPASLAPGLAGLILDNANPDWVWYAAGIVGSISVAGFLLLHMATHERAVEGAPAEAGQ